MAKHNRISHPEQSAPFVNRICTLKGVSVAHFLTLQSVDVILDLINCFEPGPIETLPLEDVFGRTLAETFFSPEDLPGFDRSCMDGFAVRAKDVFGASESSPALLENIGECPMGQPVAKSIGPGQCMRIWTGSMLPPGADAVVMLEYAREAGGHNIELTRPAAPLDNVICKDEDAEHGQELIPAGSILRPQEIGLLAALGQAQVTVRRKPRVAVISSGDEILPIQESPGPGQVRDVNSYTLTALARAAGAEARSLGIVRDSPEQLGDRIREALEWADVVLISGGSSAGQRDYTIQALQDLSGCEILAHGVAISPGKPLIMARQGKKSLWGLPGHVASALVCAEVFLRPLFRNLLGQANERPVWENLLRAQLTRSVASAHGRREFVRVALEPPSHPDGLLQARPILGKSGLISTLVLAQALVVCPEEREGLSEGEILPVHLLL